MKDPYTISFPAGTKVEVDHENLVVLFNAEEKKEPEASSELPLSVYEIEGLPSDDEWYALKTIFPTREMRSAFEALRNLILLRDAWNGEWRADWKKSDMKWCINFHNEEPNVVNFQSTQHVLHFRSKELAERFLNQFSNLIGTASRENLI